MIQGQKTKLNNQHEVLLPLSNQQLADDWTTKRLVLLSAAAPSSQKKQKEKQPQKILLSPEKKTVHDLGNPHIFFNSSRSSIDASFSSR